MSTRPPVTARGLLIGCAALVLALLVAKGLVQQATYQWFTLLHPYTVNPMEGREAVKAWMLGRGASLYPVLPGPSWIVTIYPPLYHALTLALAKCTGDYFFAGRVLSLLATAALAVIIAAWVRHAGAGRAIAVLAGVSFLTNSFMRWGVQARPDMVSLALAMGGAFLFLRARRRSDACWAALLAAMALFTKQQTLPFILGTALYGLVKGAGQRKRLLDYAVSLVVFIAIPGALLNMLTHGQFAADIIAYPARMSEIPGVFSMFSLQERLLIFWRETAWQSALTGLWLLVCLVDRRLDFAGLLLVVNAPFVLRILGTWGADYNYTLCIVALMYPSMGMLAARCARIPRVGTILALAVLILMNVDGRLRRLDISITDPHLDKWSGVREELAQTLRNTPGPVLINTEGGQLVLGLGQDDKLMFFDSIELGLYEKAGYWAFTGSSLAQAIAQRRFSLVVLSNDFMPRAMTWLVRRYYEPSKTLGQYELYAPRPATWIVPVTSLESLGQAGEVSVALKGQDNIKAGPDHIEPLDQSRPATLTLDVSAPVPLEQVALAMSPRLNHSDGSSLTVTVSDEGGEERVWVCPRSEGKQWSGVWEMQTLEHFPVQGRKVRITFRMEKNAQLFFTPERPMTVNVSARP